MYKKHLFYFLFFIHSVFTFAQDTLSPPVVILSAACPKPITTIARNPTIIPLAVLKNNKGETIKNEKGSPFILGEAGGYSYMQNYNTDQGLPTSGISSSYADHFGNLWFGTYGGGISRYDGKSFINYTIGHGLVNNIVLSILEDKKGNLWFGTDGGGVSCFDGKLFTNYTIEQGLAGNIVRSILEDKSGNIWFGTFDGGVSCYNGKSFTNYTTINGLANNVVFHIMEDKKGNLWFGTSGGGVSCYNGKSFTNYTIKQGLGGNFIRNILEDKKGNIWFGTSRDGVSCYNGEYFTNYTISQGLANNTVQCIFEDKTGNLWFATDGGGISRYDGKYFTSYTTTQGLANNVVFSIMEDKAGHLWFGSYGGGVSRYDGKFFTSYTTTQGLANNIVFSIMEDKAGDLWFGTYRGGVSCYNGESFTNYSTAQGLANNTIYSMMKDKKNNLWFGTDGSGVSCFDGKSFTNYNTTQGLANNIVYSIIEDKKGNLWFGTYGGGISCFDGKSFTNYTTAQGLVNNSVQSIFEDKTGNIWFATDGGGVSCYNGISFKNYADTQGLANYTIYSIMEDKKGNLWFGTGGGGVFRFDGKSFTNYTTEQGLPDNIITQVISYEDQLIIGSNFGIGVISKFIPKLGFLKEKNDIPAQNDVINKELVACYDPAIKIFNEKTGYPVKDVNAGQNTMYCDSKGMIWIATGNNKTALVRFDPSGLKTNLNPPTVVIQSIKINEEIICWYDLNREPEDGSRKIVTSISGFRSSDSTTLVQQEMMTYGKKLTKEDRLIIQKRFAGIQFDTIARFYPIPEKLTLPYEHNHVTFDFAAIEPAKPYLINYQYFMKGYDKEWMPITKNTSAKYGNINEGDYSFMVKAQSPDGVWSEPVIYKFTVLPPWYRHTAAIIGYIILFITAFIISIRLYTMRLRAQKKRLEQIVKDRTKEIQEKNIQLETTNIVIAQKNKDITDSINYARRIQLAIMEEKEVIYNQIPNSFILYMPRDIVSGDFYYYNKINEDEVILAVCDCTGHGVPGAFMSMIGNDQLNYAIIEKKITTPSKILDQLHEGIRFALHQNKETSMVRDGMDLSLCKINLKKKELEYAGAHRPLWVLRNGKESLNNNHSENAETSTLLEEIKADNTN